MSQETLKSRLDSKYEKQLDCPISCYENFTEKLISEFCDILEINDSEKDSFCSQLIFTEKGIIVCGFLYLMYENNSDTVTFNFIENVNSNSEQFLITTKIFQNARKIISIVSKYYEFLCTTQDVNTEVRYEMVDKVMRFVTDSKNINKTCKFEIPFRKQEQEFISDFCKIKKVVLYLTVETAYLISFSIVKETKDEDSKSGENILNGKLSVDSVEVFVKELYYSGKIVNYGR